MTAGGFVIFNYIKKHILGHAWFRISIPAMIGLELLKMYSDIARSYAINKLTERVVVDRRSNMQAYLVFSLAVLIMEFFTSYSRSIFKAHVRCGCIDAIFRQFMSIRWGNNWRQIINSDLYGFIIRKSHAIADILTIISCSVIFRTIAAVLSMREIAKISTGATAWVIVLAISCYALFFFFLEWLKGAMSVRMYVAFDAKATKAKDIFCNYDLIHTFGTLEHELDAYSRALEAYVFYVRMDWLLGSAFKVMKLFFAMGVRVFLLVYGLDAHPDSTVELKMLMRIFESTFRSVGLLVEDFETMAQQYPQAVGDCFKKLEMEASSEKGMHVASFADTVQIIGLSHCLEKQPIYTNVNLSIKRGEKIAITGYNGTGKSTFLKQLLGLVQLRGRILVDGVDISAIERASRRRLFAYIPQEMLLFNASLLDNIRCFNTAISEEEVVRCCMKLGIHEELKEYGYASSTGECGSDISFSLRQKVLLGRAVVYGAPIIAVDEFVSETDDLQALLDRLTDKTLLMITHDMRMLKYFDRIFFFTNGGVYEGGSFEDACRDCPEFLEYYNSNQ